MRGLVKPKRKILSSLISFAFYISEHFSVVSSVLVLGGPWDAGGTPEQTYTEYRRDTADVTADSHDSCIRATIYSSVRGRFSLFFGQLFQLVSVCFGCFPYFSVLFSC